MRDILNYAYAIVLLTAADFAAPCCPPPQSFDGAAQPPPVWMAGGSANAYQRFNGSGEFDLPGDPFSIHRPLRTIMRASDPNAGIAPMESYDDDPVARGYQMPYYWEDGRIEAESYRVPGWVEGHAANHVGGTMQPIQGIPQEFTPYYIGFEEELGGYNFGGGNAQLDFSAMRFDWACG